jgi:hypothetical protein
MSDQLAQKTCSIDRMITVEKDVQKVLSGEKTCQRRNGRYADAGEIWEIDGRKFEVYNVFQQPLGDMTEADAHREGFSDMETYKQNMLSMHPGMPWVPKMKAWVHEFREVK